METMLLKLARQLDTMDEASLMSLWEIYAEKTRKFEPTKRWEEAVLVFSFLQAKRWKNQLFNYYWAEQARPAPAAHDSLDIEGFGLDLEEQIREEQSKRPEEQNVRRAKILAFNPHIATDKSSVAESEDLDDSDD